MAYKTLTERMAERQLERAQTESGLPPMAPMDSTTERLNPPGRPARPVTPVQLSRWTRVMNAPVIKQGLGALSFAATELSERSAEFRGALSLIAPGGIPLTSENLKKAAKFDLELTGKEFFTHIVGQDMMDELDAIGFGQYKALNPHTNNIELRHRFSLGDAASFVTDVVVDPFVLLGALPRAAIAKPLQAIAKTKLGAYGVTKVGQSKELGYQVLDAIGAHKVLSPRASWGRYAPELVDELEYAQAKVQMAFQKNHETVGKLFKAHKTGKLAGAWKSGEVRPHVIWARMAYGKGKLNSAEQALWNDMQGLLQKAEGMLAANGDTTMKFYKKTPHGRIMKQVRFNPQAGLSQFRPYVRGLRRPPIQKQAAITDLSVRNSKHLPWKSMFEQDDVLKNIKNVPKANRDPAFALEQFLNDVSERVIWHEREFVAPLAPTLKKAQEAGKSLRPRVIKRGFLEKYKLMSDDWGVKGQSAAVASLGRGAFLNFKDKVHQITGHARDRNWIAHRASLESFMYNLSEIPGVQAGTARWNRIVDGVLHRKTSKVARDFYLDTGNAVPFFDIPPVDVLANTMVKNIMLAALGGNLGSSVKNTSQLFNTAAVEGVGPVMKGLYRLSEYDGMGKTLRRLRRAGGLEHGSTIRFIDDHIVAAFGKFENTIMHPFNLTEYMARGVSYNIAVERELIKMFGTAEKATAAVAKGLKPTQLRNLVKTGLVASNRFNFTYGIAGRSQFLQTPLFKVGLALQSYSWKMAAFSGNLLLNDTTSFVRLLAYHGATIEMMHKFAGINAENWLGWGFIGGMPMASGPATEALSNFTQMLLGMGSGDLKGTEIALRQARQAGNDLQKLPWFSGAPEMVGMAGYLLGMSGIAPVPIVGITKFARAYNYFVTGRKEGADGEYIRPITPGEATASLFFSLSADVERQALASLDRKNQNNFNATLNKRISKYLEALKGNDRDEVIRAGRAIFDWISVQTQSIPAGSTVGKYVANWAATKGGIRPHPRTVMGRIKRRLMAQKAPRAVREMLDGGFIDQVTNGLWAQEALQDLEKQMNQE